MIKFYLFTDGGQFRKQKEPPVFDSVTSVRVLCRIDGGEPELLHTEQVVNVDSTGNFSEVNAIRKSLGWVVKTLRDSELYTGDVEIELYTDSMLYHQSLTKWIYGWLKRAKAGYMYSSSKTPVANQEEIIIAFKFMEWLRIRKNASVKFFHVNSHTAKKSFKFYKDKFEAFNKCKVSNDEFAFILLQNQYCDESVKTAYKQYKLNLISKDTTK